MCIQFPSNGFADFRSALRDVREVLLYNYVRNGFLDDLNQQEDEELIEQVFRVRLLENELERLIYKIVDIALKIFYYEK